MRDLQFYTHEAKRCVPYLSPEDQLAWAEHALETHPGFGSLPQPESTPQPVIETPIAAAPIVESPDPVSYPPAPAPQPQKFGFVDWWRIAVLILLLALCVINARAQDPASQGIILGFQQSGTTLAQRGTGIARLNCSTGMTCTWTAATNTFTLTSTGGGGGGSPCGALGELQTYATSSTFGCGNLFYDGSQYYIFGTNDFSGTAPALGFAANQFSVNINQSLNSQLIALTFSAGGAFGADLNSVSILVEAQADSITKYFDSQMNFGAVSGDGSTSALPYTMGAEGHCATVNSCVNGTLTDYDFFLINGVTGETLLQNTSASAHQLSVPAVTQFATLGNYVAVGPIISNDTTGSNPLYLSKNAIADAAPGAGYVTFKAVAGTNSGTCKIVMKAGTSATPVTLVDNVGSGC